jgi:hypothetical protein
MRRLLALSVALIALVAAGFLWTRDRPVAVAQLPPPPLVEDVPDGDGEAVDDARPKVRAPRARLTPEEREARRFNRRDKDKDGVISRAEYLADRKKAFERQDLNGDGRLDFEEFAAATAKKFAKADRNGDRLLDAREFATTAAKRRAPSPAAACACDEDS